MLMKLSIRNMGRVLAACCPILLALILTSGCETVEPPVLSAFPVTSNGVVKTSDTERYLPGQKLQIVLSGINELPPPHFENIKEDGTISMPNIGSVVAQGRTPGELQREIFNLYVPKYYNSNLNVTVIAQDTVLFMGGEVKVPGRILYSGDMTVTKAIRAAGDFTVFANQRRVKLTHTDGTMITVDCIKAMEEPSKDPPVFPGDKIYVPRRLF